MVRLRIAFAIFCCLSCILSVPSIIPLLLMCCLSVVLCVFLYSLFCCIESYTSLYVFHSICSVAKHSLKFLPFKGRWIQKRQFLKTEGFFFVACFYCSSLGLEPPPRVFPTEKISRPPSRGTTLSVCFAKLSLKFLPLKGRWIQKRQFLKTEGFFFVVVFVAVR